MRETTPVSVLGPLGGISEFAHPSTIAPTDFVLASNVVNVAGTLKPRPGYELLDTINVTTDATGISTTVRSRCMAYDSATAPDEILFTNATTVRSIQVSGSYTETEICDLNADVGETDARGIAYDSTNSTIYVAGYNQGQLYTAGRTPGTATVLVDLITAISWNVVSPSDIYFNSGDIYVSGNGNDALSTDYGLILTVNATTTTTSVLASSSTKIFGAMESWPAKSRIYVSRCDPINPTYTGTVGTLTPDASIDVYTTAGAFITNVSTGSVGYVVGLYRDTSVSRLYAVCNNSGTCTIGYWELHPSTGLINSSFISVFTTTGDLIDTILDADGNLFWSDDDASSGGITTSIGSVAGTIVSGFWWENDIIGTNSAPDDVVLFQALDVDLGGSTFHAYFPTRTSPDDLIALTPQYTQGTGGDPDIFVMPDRDADGTSATPIVPAGNFSRSSFAFMGKGLDSHQGGVLIGTGAGAYVFNYHKGEPDQSEVQVLAMLGQPNANSFTLSMLGSTTSAIAYNANSTTISTILEAGIAELNGNISVTGGPINTAPVTITFTNSLANTSMPLFVSVSSMTAGAGDVPGWILVGHTTSGTQHPDGILWLRPAGLPRPEVDAATPTAAANANLNGVYDYVISYYSSRLNIESPPSSMSRCTTNSGQAYVDLSWTNPSTRYFDDTYGSTTYIRPVCDYVRIYRRRSGNALVSGSPDGNGADATYKFVQQVPAIQEEYRDNVADGTLLEDQPPSQKEYPPDDTALVTIHDQHAYFVQAANASRLVWYSPPSPIVGSVADGELTYEYSPVDANFEITDLQASDHSITSIRSFANQLCVWTDKRLFACDTTDVDIGVPIVRTIEGAVGCASHWCVVESNPLPDLSGGLLFYPHPIGGMYAFDGSRATPVARTEIQPSIATWSRRTWQDLSAVPSASSWYYASAISDPDNNRIILGVPLADGTSETYCYNLDLKKWTKWTISATLWLLGRDVVGASPSLDPVPLLGFGNAIYLLKDGWTDDGTEFSWSLRSGKQFGPIASFGKNWYDGIVLVDSLDFGGNSASLTITPLIDGRTINARTAPVSNSTTSDTSIPFSAKGHRGRFFQLQLSGSITGNSQSHPVIYGWAIDCDKTSSRMRIKKST